MKFTFEVELDIDDFVENTSGKNRRELLNTLMDDYMENKFWSDAKRKYGITKKRNIVDWMEAVFLQCGFSVDNLRKHWNELFDGESWGEFFWYLEEIRAAYSEVYIEIVEYNDETIFYCPLCGKPWKFDNKSDFPAQWTMSCGDHVGNLEARDGSYTYTVVEVKQKEDEVIFTASDNPFRGTVGNGNS